MRAFAFFVAILLPTAAAASETQSYSYDELGRLTAVQYSGTINNGQAHSLCYDPAGNRTKYKSDAAGILATCTAGGGGSAPSFAISDASAVEGGTVIFTATKTGSASTSHSVNYATANGTAVAGSDHTATSGALTFAASETSKTVSIATIDDVDFEGVENFYLNLSGASGGATISDAQGVGTIHDNDEAPGCYDSNGQPIPCP